MAKLKKLRGGKIIEVDPQILRWRERIKRMKAADKAKVEAEKARLEAEKAHLEWVIKVFE